jgi:ribulose-5-phosphate 4-epimerase/fuculose-1-phosphate aldolase
MPDSTLFSYQPDALEGKVSDAEWQTRVDMAVCYRIAYHFGWNDTIHNHLSARVPDDPEKFVMNPQGLGWHEMTASSLIKSDFNGNDFNTSEFRLAPAGRNFHGAILKLRPDLNCVFHIHPLASTVVSATRDGLLPLDQSSAMMYGRVSYHDYEGLADEAEEGPRIVEHLGDNLMMIMWNHGLLTVGRTIAEAMAGMAGLVKACENQMHVLALNRPYELVPEEICRKSQDKIYERGQGRPGGALEFKMYRRLAEKLDPSYRT